MRKSKRKKKRRIKLLPKAKVVVKAGVRYKKYEAVKNKEFNNRGFRNSFGRNKIGKKLSKVGKGALFQLRMKMVRSDRKVIEKTLPIESLPKQRYEWKETTRIDRRTGKKVKRKYKIDLWKKQIATGVMAFLKQEGQQITNYNQTRRLFKRLREAGFKKAKSLKVNIDLLKGKNNG